MIHLTMTGYYAGLPLCNCNKAERLQAGDKFIHAMYCPDKLLQSPDMCQECLKVWTDTESDDKTNPAL